MEPGDARNVLTQLRRGTIEYCVLAVLAKEEEYAFELVRRLSAVDGLVTSEGTIYPLLSRLRRDGMVTTTWQESDTGPPRKYYRLTPTGRRALSGFTEEWTRFRDAVDELLVGGRGPSKGGKGGDRGQ
jgi:PadR family transcriptional regulator, regulatory protein PadR